MCKTTINKDMPTIRQSSISYTSYLVGKKGSMPKGTQTKPEASESNGTA